MIELEFKPNLNVLALSYLWEKDPIFAEFQQKGHFSNYLTYVLGHSPIPEFKFKKSYDKLFPKRKLYQKFGEEFRRASKAKLAPLKKVFSRPIDYGPEKKRFPKILSKVSQELRPNLIKIKRIQVVPNILGKLGEGYGIKLGSNAYLVYRPQRNWNQTWLLVHELLHTILGDEFKKPPIVSKIRATEKLYSKFVPSDLRQYYPYWHWAIEEYIIHAIDSQITKEPLEIKKEWGWEYIDFFVQKWQERGRTNFTKWLENLLEEIALAQKS